MFGTLWWVDKKKSGENESLQVHEATVKGTGEQLVFSNLPVAGSGVGRNKKTQQIDTSLQGWWHCQDFEVFDDGFGLHNTGPASNTQHTPVTKKKGDFFTGVIRRASS